MQKIITIYFNISTIMQEAMTFLTCNIPKFTWKKIRIGKSRIDKICQGNSWEYGTSDKWKCRTT